MNIIRCNKKIMGFVSLIILMMSSVMAFATDYYQVNTKSRLNVRQSPATNSAIITQLQPGETIEMLQTINDKTLIRTASGHQGFVPTKYITFSHSIEDSFKETKSDNSNLIKSFNLSKIDFKNFFKGPAWLDYVIEHREKQAHIDKPIDTDMLIKGLILFGIGLIIGFIIKIWVENSCEIFPGIIMLVLINAMLLGAIVSFEATIWWWNGWFQYILGIVFIGIGTSAIVHSYIFLNQAAFEYYDDGDDEIGLGLAGFGFITAFCTGLCHYFEWAWCNYIMAIFIVILLITFIAFIVLGFKEDGLTGFLSIFYAISYFISGILLTTLLSLIVYIFVAVVVAVISSSIFWFIVIIGISGGGGSIGYAVINGKHYEIWPK